MYFYFNYISNQKMPEIYVLQLTITSNLFLGKQ